MEADLARYYGIDYRDRWRRDEAGRRRLTLRMILVRIRYLPVASATLQALGASPWSTTDYLISDLFHAHAGKPHPARPKVTAGRTARRTPARDKAMRAARARAAARRRAIEAGEIT